ncbi:uncharacterized protein LOC111327330 [Stylophora pistillata]|uniref:uncharacterized protein LOC111327330 n=1 Tax=Stylophora pistillata TaxID=50429 RepID=UPI000C047347|nr:uncharacterized protein LOC111327330 [Stylophora pistillata]
MPLSALKHGNSEDDNKVKSQSTVLHFESPQHFDHCEPKPDNRPLTSSKAKELAQWMTHVVLGIRGAVCEVATHTCCHGMTLKKFFGLFAFLVISCQLCLSSDVFQAGKVNITDTSQNSHGCQSVSFKTQFQGSGDIKVFVTLSHGNKHIKIQDPAALWVKSISTSGFKACVREAGSGSAGMSVINWLSFQGSHQGIKSGIVDFDEWTTRTQCKRVSIFDNQSNGFKNKPQVFISVQHKHTDRPYDSMNLWLEGVSKKEFYVCMRELMSFDGIHSDLKVHWFAYDVLPSNWNFTEEGKIHFAGNGAPLRKNYFAFCQDFKFENPFYEPPTVLISGSHKNTTSALWGNSEGPCNNAINVWIEEVSRSAFKVCVKDSRGLSKSHDPITVHYAIIGDLDPCINVTCDYYAVCKAFDTFDARCVCEENCPSYEEQVCSSSSTTFKNKCMFELDVCRLKSNHTVYHPGSCMGFPVQKGRIELKRDVSWAETACELVTFQPFSFYPDKEVHVQITTNHWNSTRRNFVHEATVSWVENVNYQNFRVCATAAGRNDRGTKEFATVDWMAYQGAPNGGVTGNTRIPEWWTGTKCIGISLPKDKFAATPIILATADHVTSAYKHDAASLWIENATSSTFHICLRELQNYDGLHEDILVNWMAFEEIHRPLFAESRKIDFPNNSSVSANYNGAFCKDVQFAKTYDKEPKVVITANHNSEGNNLKPKYISVTAWIEHIQTSEFRICLKELFADQHDPVTVSYVVLADVCKPGWFYFSGFCYSTSQSCKNWTEAQKACQLYNTSLITVKSQEENVYIQHRLNGDKGWIGLNDRDTEGTFVWAGNQLSNFTYWAPRQPNDFRLNEDCVHTLGVGHKFEWNDVDCKSCHNYTCSEDLDECTENNHDCSKNGICTNTQGSFNCHCAIGFRGDGWGCTDIDECSSGYGCPSNASCQNTYGSYTCTCDNGYTGDGITCRDVDECVLNNHNCDVNAKCTNTQGSFTCQCNITAHYYGNGTTCNLFRGLGNSSIVGRDSKKMFQLDSWLQSRLQSQSRSYWKLCYRASSHGWSSRTFHSRCDNLGKTVTIIEAHGYIFGGYTSSSWTWNSGYTYSSNAFIFSLKNYYGYGYFKKDIYYWRRSYATYSYYNYGPTFGSGHDIYVANNANSNYYSYFNDRSYHGSYSSDYVWTGNRNFRADEVEVYCEVTI